jgi:ELWxxDGT repeat protein
LEALEERTLLSLSAIKDINPVNTGPAEMTVVGENVYFVTTGADGGTDVDVKNSTGVTVLKDFPPGSLNVGVGILASQIAELTPVGSKLFFLAHNGGSEQLWVTDGTVAGTSQVAPRLTGGTSGPIPTDLAAVGSELFFHLATLSDPGTDALYRTDGTDAGTLPVPAASVNAPFKTTNSTFSASFGGSLYFTNGPKLLKTDGVVTTLIGTFPAKSNGFAPAINDLVVVGGMLYFTATDASGDGEDLFASNGTRAGTRLLKDFNPSPGDYSSPIDSLTPVGSRLFFTVDNAANGPSLWVSDGTVAGTKLVKPLPAPPANSNSLIIDPTAAGSKLFFATETPGAGPTGLTLWVSNGTPAGTTKVANITLAQEPDISGVASALVGGQFAAVGGTLYFANDDPNHGMELWQSNGTAAGTTLVSDLDPGPGGSYPANMAAFGNTLYFSAAGAGSSAVWQSDGTAAGTTVVATVDPRATAGALLLASQYPPDGYATLGNTIVFAADDGVHGIAIWKTDGITAGTTLVKVLGAAPFTESPIDFTTVGNRVYFVVKGADTNALWMTDGTATGTARVTAVNFTFADPTAFNGKLAFFESNADGSGLSLWVSDGTASGTKKVKTFANMGAGEGASPAMTVFNTKLYVLAPQAVNGEFPSDSVWVSNGTAAGTSPLAAKPAFSGVQSLAAYGGAVYFIAGAANPALWVTNGTPAGTKMVKLLNADATALIGSSLVVAGSTLYIVGNGADGNNPIVDLYRSDGTNKGTAFVKSIPNPGEFNSYQSAGLPNGKLVLAIANAAANAQDLWVSDGTAARSVKLQGVSAPFTTGALTAAAGRVYFQASDSAHGIELWQSDGTVAGTTLVQDINPGAGSSYPYALGMLNGNLIVAANDGVHGNELLTSGDPSTPEPTLAAIAPQSITATNLLTFTASGTPSLTGDPVIYSLESGAPAGAKIDPSTGVFTWAPAHPMAATIAVVVTDQTTGLSASASVKVTVSGVKPTVLAGADATVKAKTLFTRGGTFSAPSYATLTATVRYGDGTGAHPLTLNKNGTFTLKATYTKAGSYKVVVTLTDQYGDSSSTSFVVTVK